MEVPSAADDRFTYRIDRGEQIYGGFEIHVYKNGEEVAKINGHGGWADKHGGKKLPYKPSEFRDAFEEVEKELRGHLKDEVRRARGAGWRGPKGGNATSHVAGALLLFSLGYTACDNLNSVAESDNFKKMLKALTQGDLGDADKWAQFVAVDIGSKAGAIAQLNFEKAWREARRAATAAAAQ